MEDKKHQRWAVPQDDGTYNLEDGNGRKIEEDIDISQYNQEEIEKHKHQDGSILLSLVNGF